MLTKALNSQVRKQEEVRLGTYVYFYRDNVGYKGPGKVVKVERNVYFIEFEGSTYTSSYKRLKKAANQPVEYYCDDNISISSSEDDLHNQKLPAKDSSTILPTAATFSNDSSPKTTKEVLTVAN